MRFAVNDSQLRVLFNMVDLSGNGSISKAEFIQGFYTLMRQLVPNIILSSLSVLPEQIASHILKALMFLLLLFAFLFVSMDALTPSSAADVDFMGGVQAVVAGMAALGVRVQSTSGMDLQSIKAPRPTKIMTQNVDRKLNVLCFSVFVNGHSALQWLQVSLCLLPQMAIQNFCAAATGSHCRAPQRVVARGENQFPQLTRRRCLINFDHVPPRPIVQWCIKPQKIKVTSILAFDIFRHWKWAKAHHPRSKARKRKPRPF